MSTNKEMKLILESWRGFVDEAEKSQDYGQLYIFENDAVKTVSFYDKLNMLTESEQDVSLFFEQWEKSVDYQLENLNEVGEGVLFKVALQAMAMLRKFKNKIGKYAVTILRGVSKLISVASRNKPLLIAAIAITGFVLSSLGADVAMAADIVQPWGTDQMGGPGDASNILATQENILRAVEFYTSNIADKMTPEAQEHFSPLVDSLQAVANEKDVEYISKFSETLQDRGEEAIRWVEKVNTLQDNEALKQAAEATASAVEQAPEAARSFTTGNPVTQAANALGQVLMSGDDPDKIEAAMEILKSVQDGVGAPAELKGVDLGNLDKAGARKMLQAIESAHGFKG